MAGHARQQIRKATKTVITGLTSTGDRAYDSRHYPQTDLPSWSVYVTREAKAAGPGTLGRRVGRIVQLTFEGRAKPSEGQPIIEDVADTMAAELETAIAANPKLNGLVMKMIYDGTDIVASVAQERPEIKITIRYHARYDIVETDPTTPLGI